MTKKKTKEKLEKLEQKIDKRNLGIAIEIIFLLSSTIGTAEPIVNKDVAPQYLTLPLHSGQALAGPSEEGIAIGPGGHYIWKQPFENLPIILNQHSDPSKKSSITVGSDIDVSNASSSYEGETGAASTIVASTSLPTLVGGSNHIDSGCGFTTPCTVMAYTSTNGLNWITTQMPATWHGTTFGIAFDPSIEFDSSGNFYYAYGGFSHTNFLNSIGVSKSTDGYVWNIPIAVTFNNYFGAFDDKFYIAVDRHSSPNRIYVSWDRNKGTNQILYIAYSNDGGATWSKPIKINDGTTKYERVIDAYPAVDQNTGIIYDSWNDYNKNKIFVDKSINGGKNWGKDIEMATIHITPDSFGTDIGCNGGRSQGPAHHLKVGPSGTLYLVYADAVPNRGFDILLTRSIDGGLTWSTPITLNDDVGTAHQYHPTLSVEPNDIGGDKLTVTFYDRRDDSNNCLTNVYTTQSIDNGITWSSNIKVTTASSNFDGDPNGPGDYSSSTPSGIESSSVFPFFSDHRNPDFEIYTAPIS